MTFNINFEFKSNFFLYSGANDGKLILGSTFKPSAGECGNMECNNYALHTAISDDTKEIYSRRKRLAKQLGFLDLITLKQVHSDKIFVADSRNIEDFVQNPMVEGDGIISNVEGYLFGVLTADCVPLLVFPLSEGVSFVGAVHAGWRGVKSKIHIKAVNLIEKTYGADKKNIGVIIGPHIGKCCYEVGGEFCDTFKSQCFLCNEKYFLDLESVVSDELEAFGIKGKNIFRCGLCSKCSVTPEFYSYRNGDYVNRNLNFIGIKRN